MARKKKAPAQPANQAAATPIATLPPTTAPMGRPPKYEARFAKEAKKLCELGATDRDLAEFFEVTTVTIWRWRSEHRDFCNALKVGKGAPDDRVERSLYQRAVGYSFNSVKVMQHNGVPVYADFIEHVPPDPGAAKLWLTNRRGEEWREKSDVNHGVQGTLADLLGTIDGKGRGLPSGR